jgi:hypothetical protein
MAAGRVHIPIAAGFTIHREKDRKGAQEKPARK